jgi:predicted chitinase
MAMDNITSNNNANFYWWFGVVEDRDDPLRLGRCRVRIIGYHTEDNETLPTEDLPWALPVMPANSAGTSGVGWSPTGAVEGSWVVGFFADGEGGQHPMFFGTVGSIPGGLASADCAPSEGPGSSGDNATSNGDDTVGDYGDVQQPSGNAKDLESYLESWLDINGKKIKGYTPLAKAMIMAQCNHESGGFTKMTEVGSDEYFISGINRGKKVHNGYDINSQFADGRKRARMMGNTTPGDGKKYRGRGFLGLTWKNSYRNCGDYIKKPLEQNPDLASTKEVAAEILLWYFNTQRPKIGRNNQWGDVLEVSMAINGYISKERIAEGKRPLGFEDRKKKFAFYRNKYKV